MKNIIKALSFVLVFTFVSQSYAASDGKFVEDKKIEQINESNDKLLEDNIDKLNLNKTESYDDNSKQEIEENSNGSEIEDLTKNDLEDNKSQETSNENQGTVENKETTEESLDKETLEELSKDNVKEETLEDKKQVETSEETVEETVEETTKEEISEKIVEEKEETNSEEAKVKIDNNKFRLNSTFRSANSNIISGYTDRFINIRNKPGGKKIGVMPAYSYISGKLEGKWIKLDKNKYIYHFDLLHGRKVSGYIPVRTNVRTADRTKVVTKYESGTYVSGLKIGYWIYFLDGKKERTIYDFGLKNKPGDYRHIAGYLKTRTNVRTGDRKKIIKKFDPLTYVDGIKKGKWIYFNENGEERAVYDFGLIQGDEVSGYIPERTNVRNKDREKVVDKYEALTHVEGIKDNKWIYFLKNGELRSIYDFGLIQGKKVSGYLTRSTNIRTIKGRDKIGVYKKNTYVSGIKSGSLIYFARTWRALTIYDFGLKSEYVRGYTTKRYYFRAGSSTKSKIIGYIPKGFYVQGYSENNYTQVKYNGKTGYVYSAKLKTNPFMKDLDLSSGEKPFIIMFDPGHGPGSKSNRGGLLFNEGDQNYIFTEHIRKEAEKYKNVVTFTTRPTGDEDPEMEDRALAGLGADLYFSIHTNAASPGVRGVELWASNDNKSHKFAEEMTDTWSDVLDTPNRGVKYDQKNGSYTREPRKGKPDTWWVFEDNKAKEKYMLESAFHTNIKDSKAYLKNQKTLAKKFMELVAKHFKLSR